MPTEEDVSEETNGEQDQPIEPAGEDASEEEEE